MLLDYLSSSGPSPEDTISTMLKVVLSCGKMVAELFSIGRQVSLLQE